MPLLTLSRLCTTAAIVLTTSYAAAQSAPTWQNLEQLPPRPFLWQLRPDSLLPLQPSIPATPLVQLAANATPLRPLNPPAQPGSKPIPTHFAALKLELIPVVIPHLHLIPITKDLLRSPTH